MIQSESTNDYNPLEANSFLKNVLLVSVGLLISLFFVKTSPSKNHPTKFDELLDVINNNYVDTIKYRDIEDKAVTHLLNQLDPHSIYISKEDLQAANEPLEGNFSGVGIEFYILKDTIIVVSPLSGGPSELAGIKSGDKIIKINDTIVAGQKISNTDVYKKLRGKKDSKVKLTIQRGKNILPSFVIKRDNINVNSVESSIVMNRNVGYIKINSFGEKTYDEFYQELTKLKEQNIQSLVLDLRQNTGGFLEIAALILDELIDEKKLLVYTQGLHFNKEQYFTKRKGLFEQGNLAVLIDEGSASASEIVAGAIQDLDRGIVVGRRSFGKGLVQNQISLSDGSAVRLTVAKYYTPSGRNIQKPYKANSHYEDEVYDRYKNGEFFDESKQSSTDTTVYLTSKGRKVKGGGGISPDYFVSIDTNFDYNSYSALRTFIPEFIYSQMDQISQIKASYKSAEEFNIKFQMSDKQLMSFYQYASKSGAKWSTIRKSSYEHRIKSSFKAYLAKQIYGDVGFYSVHNSTDLVVQKAINQIKIPLNFPKK